MEISFVGGEDDEDGMDLHGVTLGWRTRALNEAYDVNKVQQGCSFHAESSERVSTRWCGVQHGPGTQRYHGERSSHDK